MQVQIIEALQVLTSNHEDEDDDDYSNILEIGKVILDTHKSISTTKRNWAQELENFLIFFKKETSGWSQARSKLMNELALIQPVESKRTSTAEEA
jgi:hypothetical protein